MKTAQIKSCIWSDPWIQELTRAETIIFLNLISNERGNTLGIYEVSTRTLAFETKSTEQEIRDTLEKFSEANKAFYHKNYVILANRVKYNSDSRDISKNFVKIVKEIPREVIEFAENTKTRVSEVIKELTPSLQGVNRVYTGCSQSNLTQSNLIKPNSTQSKSASRPSEIDDDFLKLVKEIQEELKLTGFDIVKLNQASKLPEGETKIREIYAKVTLSERIKNKKAYFLKAIGAI